MYAFLTGTTTARLLMSLIMTRTTAYDQFVSNELDPISCLEPVGINDNNKFNVLELAGVLASFGDFKDKKYRLKIRKEQSVMIQAVRYLLEKSASEPTLGKRQLSETVNGLTDVKKRKTYEGALAKLRPLDGTNEAPEAAKHKPACTFSALLHQEIPVREADVEAALALQDMAKKNTTEDSLLSARNAHRWDTIMCSDVPKSSNLPSGNISASRTYLSKAPQMLSKARIELATNWHLDTELHGTRLKDVVVTIRGTDLPPTERWYGAYEGKSARVTFVSSAANKPLVSVKLLQAQPPNKGDGSICTEPELGEEAELKIPARFLVPLLPEKCGDDVVVLRVHGEQSRSKIKGTRWQVRAFVTGGDDNGSSTDDEDKGEGEGEVLDLVDIESEAGHLRLPRACLAKCFSSNY